MMQTALNFALVAYNHLSRRADKFFEKGWRRSFGWSVPLIAVFSYVYAPMHGLTINYDAVNVMLGLGTAAFFGRGVEQVMNTRATTSPTGGLVNNGAIA